MSLEGHRLVYLRAFHKWINERGGKSEKEVFTEFLKYIKNQLRYSVVFDVDIIEVIFESIDESKTKKIDESYQHIQNSRTFIVFLARNKFIEKSHQKLAIQRIKKLEKQGNYPIIKLSKHLGACTTQEQFQQQWDDKSAISEYSAFWTTYLDADDYSIKIRLNNIYQSFLRTGAINKLSSELKNRLQQYFCTMNGADQQQTKINQLLLQWAQSKLLRQSSTLRKKLDSQFNMIKEIVSEYEEFNKYDLKIGRFGSLQNGFATQEADLDITILTNSYIDQKKIVQALGGFMKLRLQKSEFEVVPILSANIPIIQLKSKEKNSDQKIDIAVNNICGIINSRFLKVYSQYHPGVRALGVLLKLWGKNTNIINKDKMSSYSVVIMMLYYLIRMKEIPIILQKITDQDVALTKIKRQKRGQKEQFSIENYFDEKLKKRTTKFNIYKHLIGFIDFYKQDGGYFNQKRAISLDLSEKQLQNDKLYTIKDPFDVPHNPGRVGVGLKGEIFKQMNFLKLKLQRKNISEIKALFFSQ